MANHNVQAQVIQSANQKPEKKKQEKRGKMCAHVEIGFGFYSASWLKRAARDF